jgi:hypothetical protein
MANVLKVTMLCRIRHSMVYPERGIMRSAGVQLMGREVGLGDDGST